MQADPVVAGDVGVWTVLQGTASAITELTDHLGGEPELRRERAALDDDGGDGTTSDQVAIWCHNNASPAAEAGPDQTVPPWPGSGAAEWIRSPLRPPPASGRSFSGSGTFW
ncbi:MAG: hypothetical protein IPF41_12270 [Flavobacteriales bacterium]|nr:hypothetical protein [Flavobacteriales bacterium]